jgi:hypothetical protein
MLESRLKLDDVGAELAAGDDQLALDLMDAREVLVSLRDSIRQARG